MTAQTDAIAKAPEKRLKNRKDKRVKRSLWAWLGWGLLVTLILLIVFGFYAWTKRYDYAASYVKSVLAEQGIEADLSIETLTRERTVLNDVKLIYQSDSAPFFTAKRIEADYILKDALEGRMQKLRFVEPSASIKMDENFRIIDGWVPPQSSDEPSGITLPPEGFFLEDASFSLETPYGSPNILASAIIRETDVFDATLIFEPTALNYQSWETEGSARLDIKSEGETKTIDALMRVNRLSGTGIILSEATLNMDGVLTVDSRLPVDLETLDMQYKGAVSGTAERLETTPFALRDSQFDWRGDIARRTASNIPISLIGDLDLSTEQFTFADGSRARELAETISLSDALSKTPIAQHFSPSVTQVLEQLLQQSSIKTAANLAFDESGGVIRLNAPLEVERENKHLDITALADEAIYDWKRSDDSLKLSLNAALNAPVPMTLKQTRIGARSQNGWQLQGVETFSGEISTEATWRRQVDGEAARLAPFSALLDYAAGETRRLLKVQGGIDFDGRLPGGYVEGLRTGGVVDIRLAPRGKSGLDLSFQPFEPRIYLNTLSTDTDWRLETVSLLLPQGQDIFSVRGGQIAVDAALEDVSFQAVHVLDDRRLSLALEKTQAVGVLNSRASTQEWQIDFENARMLSDTMPVEGTRAFVPLGAVKVLRTSDTLNFDFETPSMDVDVPQGQVTGLQVSVSGTPTEYTVNHSLGNFTSRLADIPQWPVEGLVKYAEGKFVGDARAIIPKANNTPINITYDFTDGVAIAKVRLESLEFKPRKLQPQTLIPALSGKIAAVEGFVAADFNLRFEAGKPLQSDGLLSVIDMNFGTAPGPVSGLNTEIRLTSLFPLQTAGRQSLTLDNFDPGFPLADGTVEYELVPEGVKIYSATWPMGVGSFALDPFTWKYGAPENRVVMRLNEIPIEEFLNSVGNGKLQATGNVRGEFPIVVRGIDVLVDKGFLEAKDGGIIRYNADEGTAITYSQDEALDIIRRQDTAQYRSLARDALREFTYRELSASIDGPLDGDVQLGVIFDGANEKVLNGQPFEFDIDVQGELFNILRSFNSNAQIKSELLRKGAEESASP